MSTSGSANFATTRNQMITDAYIALGVIEIDESLDGPKLEYGSRMLDRMLKHWSKEEIKVWCYGEATLFLESGTYSYELGPSGDHATNSYVETAIATAAISGAQNIAVDDDEGMVSGDNIGVMLDSGAIFWTTILGTPFNNNVVLAAPLTGAAAADNAVVTYTSKISKPLALENASWRSSAGQETPLRVISRLTYREIPNKSNTGTPNQIYYDSQRASGTLNVWPVPTDESMRILFTYKRPIEDMDAGTNSFDLPTEWELAIQYNLAVLLAPGAGVSMDKLQMLSAYAEKYLDTAMGWDKETSDIQFQPEYFE